MGILFLMGKFEQPWVEQDHFLVNRETKGPVKDSESRAMSKVHPVTCMGVWVQK